QGRTSALSCRNDFLARRPDGTRHRVPQGILACESALQLLSRAPMKTGGLSGAGCFGLPQRSADGLGDLGSPQIRRSDFSAGVYEEDGRDSFHAVARRQGGFGPITQKTLQPGDALGLRVTSRRLNVLV